jgi:hypothetical protein
VCLFLSSYVPLFLILLVLYWGTQPVVAYAAVALMLGGALGLLGLWLWVRRTKASPLEVAAVERQDPEVLGYLVVYLFPFLDLPLGTPRGQAVGLLLFLVVGLLYVHSAMLHVNPTLAVLGVHVYEVESTRGKRHTVITRADRLLPGDELDAVDLERGIHWGTRA